MGRPKKDPALVRDVPINFRVTKSVKDAITTMVERRAGKSGDDSYTGWFLDLVYSEAERQGIQIAPAPAAPAAPAVPTKLAARKRAARRRS